MYVSQPPGFESFEFPNHVYKLKRAMYGLKQAPRAWYERLRKFLLDQGFSRGKVDTTLFIKHQENHSIFGSTNRTLVKEFSKLMQGEFEMSMMGELTYFLGLQIKQLDEGTFVSQTCYQIS